MSETDQALERLKAGNQRFLERLDTKESAEQASEPLELTQEHRPFAAILGCADARVPPELVFDQRLSDLFIVRVAGNIAGPSQVGSIEFAIEHFGVRLVVVLGHSRCGAINATLAGLESPTDGASDNLLDIVERIRPSVEETVKAHPDVERDEILAKAVRANIRTSMNQLSHTSKYIEDMIHQKEVVIVGGEYDLSTGQVDFFDL